MQLCTQAEKESTVKSYVVLLNVVGLLNEGLYVAFALKLNVVIRQPLQNRCLQFHVQ